MLHRHPSSTSASPSSPTSALPGHGHVGYTGGLTLAQKLSRALSPNADRVLDAAMVAHPGGEDADDEEGQDVDSAEEERVARSRLERGMERIGGRRTSHGSIMSSRSHSRGREQIVSTGRGGAGNFLRSPSREAKLGVDESLVGGVGGERGRTASPGGVKITSSGRGGSGNIRAPSQTPADRIRAEQEEELEDRLIHERRGREIATDAPYSTGRGGAGNIGGSGSRSRSRSALGRTGTRSSQATDRTASTIVGAGHPVAREQTREGPLKHMITGGRGGWGNIAEEKPFTEHERKDLLARQEADQTIIEEHRAQEVDQPHSSGKGGFGNIHKDGANGQVDLSELSLEEKAARERYHANDKDPVIATGKGGAGNIFHAHTHPTPWDKHEDQAADGERRGRDLKTHSNGVIHNVLRSISRAGRSDKEKSTERGK